MNDLLQSVGILGIAVSSIIQSVWIFKLYRRVAELEAEERSAVRLSPAYEQYLKLRAKTGQSVPPPGKRGGR